MEITRLGPADRAAVDRLLEDLEFGDSANRLAETYLSGLNSFQAWGSRDDQGSLTAVICSYQAMDEPAWYMTLCMATAGSAADCLALLEQVIADNERQGRWKFYVLTGPGNSPVLWSGPDDLPRYDYVDEYQVKAKNKCVYTRAWEILFRKTLVNADRVVRCYYLQQQHRRVLPQGGGL